MVGPLQSIHLPMRRFREYEEVDYVIVGVGSAGGVLLQRLARAGFNVVGLEAGPFWDTERDWVSDEAGSQDLYWREPRVTGGSDPLALGANNCGQGVGGGSVHWAAFTPRLHPSDFEVYTRDGVGADWPISYADIQPYYEQLELEMPVCRAGVLPLGPSAWLCLRSPPHGRSRQRADQRLHRAEYSRLHRGTGRDSGGLARRSPPLYLSRLLPAGLQSGRQSKHAGHPCSGCAEERRRNPRALHGLAGGAGQRSTGSRRALL